MLCHLLRFSAFQLHIQNIRAMQHGKIIIQKAQSVIQYTGSCVILLILRLPQSPTQCLRSLVFDERFLLLFKTFFIFNVFNVFIILPACFTLFYDAVRYESR